MRNVDNWKSLATSIEADAASLEQYDQPEPWNIIEPPLATFNTGSRRLGFNFVDVGARHFVVLTTFIRESGDAWQPRGRTLIHRRKFAKFAKTVADVLRQVIQVYERGGEP